MWQGGYLQRGDLGKGFWRPKKVHWMMEGLLLTKAGCCGSKAASRICKRPSLLTIRRFDITFIIPWLHTLLVLYFSHFIENPLHVLPDVPNWEFTVHCRAESGMQIPVITMVLLAGSVGWPGPLWLPAGRRIILPHSLHKKLPPAQTSKAWKLNF